MALNSNKNSDPFEEFEFKPINEGLGFHRKQKMQINTNSHSFNSNTFSAPLPRSESRPNTQPQFQMPSIEDDSIAKAQTAVNEILKNLNQKRQMDFVHDTERATHDYKKSKPYFFAASLDAMLIVAAFLMSMIAMLSITKIDLFMNLNHAETSRFVYVATAGLFLTVAFVYMVVNRAFLGYTPGEWAFDQCCGNENQKNSVAYIPRLVFRTLVVMATGFITMPMLSYLFNKDVAGQIAGVTLFKKPHDA